MTPYAAAAPPGGSLSPYTATAATTPTLAGLNGLSGINGASLMSAGLGGGLVPTTAALGGISPAGLTPAGLQAAAFSTATGLTAGLTVPSSLTTNMATVQPAMASIAPNQSPNVPQAVQPGTISPEQLQEIQDLQDLYMGSTIVSILNAEPKGMHQIFIYIPSSIYGNFA